MAGPLGGSNVQNLVPTPGRKTHIWFDLNNTFVAEPAFEFGRPASAMFLGSDSQSNFMRYYSGWGIRAYPENPDIIIERDEYDDAYLTPSRGTLVAASGWDEIFASKAPQSGEQPNATIGASANLSNQSYRIIRKTVSAGTDWDANYLSADQTSFPGPPNDNPYEADHTLALERVGVTVANDSEERNIHWTVGYYKPKLKFVGTFARLYFNGPAGNDGRGTGQGIYCLELTGAGHALLWERLIDSSTWVIRRFLPNSFDANNTVIHVSIMKSRECAPADYGPNGYIAFTFTTKGANLEPSGPTSRLIETLANVAIASISPSNVKSAVYRVPGGKWPTTNVSVRVDFRRDLLGFFSLSWYSYPTTELIVNDSPFELLFNPTEDADHPFEFTFRGCIPGSSSLDVTLHRADTGAELSLISGSGALKYYTCPTNVRRYFARVTMQSDGIYTPLLFDYRVVRNERLRNPGEPSWEIGGTGYEKSAITSVDIKGAERDISHQSARFEIVDPLDKLSILKLRSNMPIKIETEYDASDTSKRCVLFRGFAGRIERLKKKGDNLSGYPVDNWGRFSIQAKGVAQQLQENFVGHFMTLIDNEPPYLPYKVTDLVRSLIARCGFDYDDDFVDSEWTDIATRVYPSDLDYSQKLDMLDNIWNVVSALVRDYLNRFLYFDENLGSLGKWRLIAPPTDPYDNVVQFIFDDDEYWTNLDSPSAMSKRIVHYLPSYSQSDPIACPVKGGTVKTWIKPPECNDLTVASIGAWQSDVPQIFITRLVNPVSFNFGDTVTADPDDPDYLGRRVPLYVIDPALAPYDKSGDGLNAVGLLARRIADLTFHGIKMMTFEAPLILITHEIDATKKRPLRYYDPVLVDGIQFLIRNVNPSYKKDGVQYAMYELEAPRF